MEKCKVENCESEVTHSGFCNEHFLYLEKVLTEEQIKTVQKHKPKIKPRKMVSTGRPPIANNLVEDINRMRLKDYSLRKIASKLKVGKATVSKYSK